MARFRKTDAGAQRRSSECGAAFTLIEVLVVVAVIALLVAILLPSLSRAREQSKAVVCETQLAQLMRAALMYTSDFKGRLPGTGINDDMYRDDYNSGRRTDWLTWFGTWQVCIPFEDREQYMAWRNAPQGGRLWKYYHDEKMLRCPSARKYNGKLSYSTPENVAMAMRAPGRAGVPPLMEKVKHPAQAIQFLDEDEEHAMSTGSCEEGFGADDMLGDRHMNKATVAFFDGHAGIYQFARGRVGGTVKTAEPFYAWMIQIAPFNCRHTPEPWRFRGASFLPKFKRDSNYPPDPCTVNSGRPGCE